MSGPSQTKPLCRKCGETLGRSYVYSTDGFMYHHECFQASPSATRIAQLERDLADTRERSAEWAKSFAQKCVEAVALETENSRLQSEYASLLETVTRKVNEKIKAERELAEARNHVAELELERARFVAELDAVALERDANHNLAVANGLRAKEENQRATADEAERDRLAAEVERLPFSVRDIKRGLILFRTSNNAHDYTNFVSLTAKVDALPQVAKDELAQIMRNIAEGLSPFRASLQHGEQKP